MAAGFERGHMRVWESFEMTGQLSDTSPQAEKVQIELFRKASISRRVSLARSLSATMIWLSRRAIQRANPGFTEQEVGLRFVELHYGRELAERVATYIGCKLP